jgi:hypothetical protein
VRRRPPRRVRRIARRRLPRDRCIAVQEDEDVIDVVRDGDGVRVVTRAAAIAPCLVIGADGSGSLSAAASSTAPKPISPAPS